MADNCVECGAPTRDSWHTFCWDCYKKNNTFETVQINHTPTSSIRKIAALEARIKDLEQLALTPKKIDLLIKLCHPDKHGDSELSTEVTKWLLDKREMWRGYTRRTG